MFEVYESTKPEIIDRYTIYLIDTDYQTSSNPRGVVGCITTDGNPFDPRGIWMHGDCVPEVVGKNEKRIDIWDLPLDTQKQLLHEMQTEVE